jgi:HD-like signal output (HDOD) protein
MDKSERIESMLDGLITLPSLPSTVVRILGMLDNPDARLQDVGKIIAQDPSLSLKSLRLVNSAFFNLRDKVNSVERGIVLLGVKVVRNIVVTASVFETLKGGETSLLRHAVACGTAGRLLAKHTGANSAITDPGEAFMYGLLHDIGKIVLQQSLPAEWGRVTSAVAQGKLSAHAIETHEIGVDHAELGALLGTRWKLQEDLVAAIGGHHDLSRCATPQQRRRAAFVGLSDWLCHRAGFPALEGAATPDHPAMWQEAALNPDPLAPVIDELANSQAEIDELVNLAA